MLEAKKLKIRFLKEKFTPRQKFSTTRQSLNEYIYKVSDFESLYVIFVVIFEPKSTT